MFRIAPGGQYHRVVEAGGDRMEEEAREAGRPGEEDAQEEFDRLLAEQPDEPPTPAEQAARDENDALGDR
jgi:hypothetical protein